MKLNERLKALRKEKKLTQKELANALDVPYRTLLNWELDQRMPSYENMVKLQEFFNVSGAYLRGETDQRTPMEKWEDPELMEAMDQSIDFMMKNIGKLIFREQEITRSDYYRFFTEFQRIFNYDFEIQAYIVNILVNTLSACSRAIETSLLMKESGIRGEDPKFEYIAERELNEIISDVKTMVSFIEYE